MLKLPRFVKEFASYQVKRITINELMDKETKEEMICKIEKAVHLLEQGMITIEECMQIVSCPGKGIWQKNVGPSLLH